MLSKIQTPSPTARIMGGILALVVVAVTLMRVFGWYQANRAYEQTLTRAQTMLQICPTGSNPSTYRRDDEVPGTTEIACFEPGGMGGRDTTIFIAPTSEGWQGFYDAVLEKNEFGLNWALQCQPDWDAAQGDPYGIYDLWQNKGLFVVHGEDWVLTTYTPAAAAASAGAGGGDLLCSIPAG